MGHLVLSEGIIEDRKFGAKEVGKVAEFDITNQQSAPKLTSEDSGSYLVIKFPPPSLLRHNRCTKPCKI